MPVQRRSQGPPPRFSPLPSASTIRSVRRAANILGLQPDETTALMLEATSSPSIGVLLTNIIEHNDTQTNALQEAQSQLAAAERNVELQISQLDKIKTQNDISDGLGQYLSRIKGKFSFAGNWSRQWALWRRQPKGHADPNGPISQTMYQEVLALDPTIVPNSDEHRQIFRRTKRVIRFYAERCETVHRVDSQSHTGQELWDYIKDVGEKLDTTLSTAGWRRLFATPMITWGPRPLSPWILQIPPKGHPNTSSL
jgi:hypothetical protein